MGPETVAKRRTDQEGQPSSESRAGASLSHVYGGGSIPACPLDAQMLQIGPGTRLRRLAAAATVVVVVVVPLIALQGR